MKRIFDIIFSFSGVLLLSPVLIILYFIIIFSSKGGAFYQQIRVGQYNRNFKLLKFRSMYVDSDKVGLLTVGDNDARITTIGKIVRKYKLDELPQLFNVLRGDMSLVGPRPEVRKYVELYDQKQLRVLNLRPGITDMASIKYRNENAILEMHDNPEDAYIRIIMPDKLRINLDSYDDSQSILGSIKIILLTIKVIFN